MESMHTENNSRILNGVIRLSDLSGLWYRKFNAVLNYPNFSTFSRPPTKLQFSELFKKILFRFFIIRHFKIPQMYSN